MGEFELTDNEELDLLAFYAQYHPRSATQPISSTLHKSLVEASHLEYRGRTDGANYRITADGLKRLEALRQEALESPTDQP